MERSIQELLSIGRVVTFHACQLVSAMLYAVRRRWMQAAETADQSREQNVCYVRFHMAKLFLSDIRGKNLASELGLGLKNNQLTHE